MDNPTIQFSLPNDRSALSVLASPMAYKITDGDLVGEDGWLYDKDGRRKSKWLSVIEKIVIWEPKLKNVKTIEATRWKVSNRIRTKVLPLYQRAYRNLSKVKVAHRYHKGKEKGHSNGWWEYHMIEYGTGDVKEGISISFDWLKKKPLRPRNVALAEAFFQADDYLTYWNTWHRKVSTLLGHAFRTFLGYPERADTGKRKAILVNGRTYWYMAKPNQWGVPTWEPLSWPDDEVEMVTIP